MANTKQSSTRKRSSGSRKGSTRKTPAKKKPAAKRTTSTSSSRIPDGLKKPAIAVGATAAAVAGGLVVRSRTRSKTVLGVHVPQSLNKAVSGLDPKSVAKSVGQASKRFGKTAKSASKDLKTAGDKAESIGKTLD